MCGIAGIYYLNNKAVSQVIIKNMCDTMRHRGPDDEGYFFDNNLALGHRRLSIIDLSSAGHQPMSDDNKSIWIVYNGEVYNFVELRNELINKGYSFKTGTDTEVIIKAYQEWGDDCLNKLDGMFAFAIWDQKKKRLFCARDRFGIKPFYYYFDGSIFVFASEIKGIIQHPGVSKRVNEPIVYDYLVCNSLDHSEETFFHGIRQLLPSHSIVLEAQNGLKISKWYDFPISYDLGDFSGEKDKENADRFREIFEDSIRIHLRSDVPVGTCLSGGLDSSSVVCLANKLIFENGIVDRSIIGERQKTFTASYDNKAIDERNFVDKVLSLTGAEGNFVFPDGNMLWEELEKVVWHQDEPFISTSIYAQWNVMRKTAERKVKVLLDGQGGDELLSGYLSYAPVWVETLIRNGYFFRSLSEIKSFSDVCQISPKMLIRNLLFYSMPSSFIRFLKSMKNSQSSLVTGDFLRKFKNKYVSIYEPHLSGQLYKSIFKTSLPSLLRYEDRNSSAFSIEARVPFLDYRLVEFILKLPLDQKIRDGWTKLLLRNAMKGIIPEEIRLRRDKLGFPTPQLVWLKQNKDKITSLFSSKDFLSKDYIIREPFLSNLDYVLEKGLDTTMLWKCINLEVWMRVWGL